jgi:uncharacterized protein YndB with AHSA1/START domain
LQIGGPQKNNTRMRYIVAALVVVAALARPARAEVVDAGVTGFSVKATADVNAPIDRVFRALTEQIGRWWDPSHSFSGSAANLSIDPRPGGCFCETLPTGGVQHMTVTHINRPNTLVLQGGLGPLGTLGVAAAMEWQLKDDNGRTSVQMVYNVGGYLKGGFTQLAPVVDGVLGAQVKRLKAFAETGRPE